MSRKATTIPTAPRLDMPHAASIVAAFESEAQVLRTACGTGDLVWRRWGRGRPVVLVHGGSGSWRHWIHQIPALREGAEVWAVDLPGLGDSEMPPAPPDPHSCARVLAEGVSTVMAGRERAHVVAFSWGAHVTTLAAAQLGDAICDLTIVGSSALGLAHPPHMASLPKEHRGMSDAEKREIHRATLAILMIAEPSRIDDLAIELQAQNIARARFRSREFARCDAIKQGLARVPVPVHAIWGERDVLAYPDLDAVRRAISTHRPELDFHVVPGAGHWVMYEQPDAFNRTLVQVLGL